MKRAKAKAITLRNLPEAVARAVRERAAKYHVSLNKAVIQLLEEAAGTPAAGETVRRRDLSRFFGILSREGADAMERALAEQRRIHPEDWPERRTS